MESQCLGLAEAMGLTPLVKRVRLRSPWKQLSPHLLRLGNQWAMTPESDPIAPPWPDVLIATGRQSVAASLVVRANNPRCLRIQIQDPGIRPSLFDLVVVPRHDRRRGANVVVSRGALHRVTPARIAEAAAAWAPRFAALPRPLVAVLVGGRNGAYDFTTADAEALADGLVRLCDDYGAGLVVTPSRRTGAENEALLRQRLEGRPAYIWDGKGDNPYFALLGLADVLVTTPDSVNMVSEAASTGKPVHVVALTGGSPKFNRFHDALRADGVTRPFTGRLEPWSYAPLDDTAQVAAVALKLLAERGITPPAP